jgi:thioredoxin-like negative regulator of GroEL
VPLKLDADANEVFQERYEIGGLPTMLFLDGEGREITRMVSLVEADGLLGTMSRVSDGYASYLENIDRRSDPTAMRRASDYLMQAGNAGGAADLLRDALKAAKSGGDATAETIELELAGALLADDREGAAVKMLRRLSTSATSEEARGQALVALFRVERERGRTARADEALARLREEFPDLVPTLD